MKTSRSNRQILAEMIAKCSSPGRVLSWQALVKKGQGTFASILATPFWVLLAYAGAPSWLYLTVLLAVTFIGVWAIRVYESDKTGHDLPEVVIDEFVGMGVSLFLVPMSPLMIALAFGLFRLFDIWKPIGVRYFDENHLNGWGVMLDDVVAGLYALIIIQGLHFSRFASALEGLLK